MADIYVRSTDGSDADNGSTWALAKAKLTGASAIDAAGDTIWLSQSHSETTNGNYLNTFNGTLANPIRVLCANDAAEPPTALATGAIIAITGASSIVTLGPIGHMYGIEFRLGTGTEGLANATITATLLENCTFYHVGTGATGRLAFSSGVRMVMLNPVLRFSDAGQRAKLSSVIDLQEIVGGSLHASSTSPTVMFDDTSAGIVRGFDFTNAAAGLILTSGAQTNIKFIDCKLPASWSGSLCNTSPPTTHNTRVSLYNCDAGATNYNLWIETAWGTIRSETTLVRTGGASDGTTPLSWKLTSTVNAHFMMPLVTDEIVIWNDTTGSSKTVTVEVLHDSATALKDDEVWLRVDYLSSSGSPISTMITDAKADTLATAADQTSSSETWTTTGMSNPNKQKLSVTFTPQMKGFIHARVMLGKASYTLYVDPLLTVS